MVFLLTLPVLPTALAEQGTAPSPVEITDKAGDGRINNTFTRSADVPPALGSAGDLRRVHFENEDELGVDVVFTVESLRSPGLGPLEGSPSTNCPWIMGPSLPRGQLQPGDAIRMGVLLHAPQGARARVVGQRFGIW